MAKDSELEGGHRANAERALAKHKHKGHSEPIGLDQARVILDEMGMPFNDLEQKIKTGEWEFICSSIEETLRAGVPRQDREAPIPDKELGDLNGHVIEAPPEPSNIADQADIEHETPRQGKKHQQPPKHHKSKAHHRRTKPVKCITWNNPTTTVRKVAEKLCADCGHLVRDLAEHWVGQPPSHASYIKRGMKVPIYSQEEELSLIHI